MAMADDRLLEAIREVVREEIERVMRPRRYLTAREAAAYMGVKKTLAYQIIAQLPAAGWTEKGSKKVDVNDIDRYFLERKAQQKAGRRRAVKRIDRQRKAGE